MLVRRIELATSFSLYLYLYLYLAPCARWWCGVGAVWLLKMTMMMMLLMLMLCHSLCCGTV